MDIIKEIYRDIKEHRAMVNSITSSEFGYKFRPNLHLDDMNFVYNEVLMIIEQHCPEVLEQTEEEWLDAIKRNNED